MERLPSVWPLAAVYCYGLENEVESSHNLASPTLVAKAVETLEEGLEGGERQG